MPTRPTYFKTPSELRRWFAANHASERELLIGFYKKDSGRPSITYQEALDEALCVGWIDGVRKRVDELSYTNRFTPRAAKSHWSTVNINRVRELSARGRMKAAGLAAFEKRDRSAAARYSYEARPDMLGAPYDETFKANPRAWEFFSSQPPGYRRTATWYILSAKQEPTRLKRLAVLIGHSAHGERLPGLTRPTPAETPKKAQRPGRKSG